MKIDKYIYIGVILIANLWFTSCEDFVDIEAPNDRLVRSIVFESEETTLSALLGIHNELARADFSDGGTNSVGFLTSLSADNLKLVRETGSETMEFQQNEIQPNNQANYNLWSSAYKIIYLTNSFLEGIANSNGLDENLKKQWDGEARFIRAFTYFYLVNLYGEVPLLLTSDYRDNELAERVPQDVIYSTIKDDLHTAVNQLPELYTRGEKTQVNSFAAMGLLARVYLYLEDWEMAETYSSQVIAQNSLYEFTEDMNEAFKANSIEALWQITPQGRGGSTTHTQEGRAFIFETPYEYMTSVKLNEDLANSFDEIDKRLSNWVGYNPNVDAYYAYKHKIFNSITFPITEYSMVLRFSEQHLIRAEARAQQNKITEAIGDLDVIKKRAGLNPISESNPEINREDLLSEILVERRKEFFTEWGHRWLDLKRTGNSKQFLAASNSLWDETDLNFPIPEEERKKNPNLSQNEGY